MRWRTAVELNDTGTVRSAIQRRDTRTTQRGRFVTKRREILPLPKGEGRGEGERTLETPMPLAIYASRSRRVAGNLFLGSRGHQLWGPIELTLQSSSGRFGSLRLVPSPLPSPSGRGNTASRAATSRGALDWRKRVERFSLSPRETFTIPTSLNSMAVFRGGLRSAHNVVMASRSRGQN